MEKDAAALLLLTNRLLLDTLNYAVDSGAIPRELFTRMLDFSAAEVVKGAPDLKEHVDMYVRVTKERMVPAKA